MIDREFSPSSRIRTSNEYQRVFKARKRVYSNYFTLYHTPSESQRSRIGVITSRKQLRYAVWRNRCKRLVRETFRQHQICYQGIDMVLVSKHNVAKASNAELVQCLNQLFLKISRLQ